MSRVDDLPENQLLEMIKDLQRQLDEIKGRQTIGSEIMIQMSPQWTDNWTASTSPQTVTGGFATIDFDAWKNYDLYFEAIGFGDGTANAKFDLYNVTAGSSMSGSEVTSTAHSSASPAVVRSTKLTKPTGVVSFKARYWRDGGGGGDLANCIMARLVFKVG